MLLEDIPKEVRRAIVRLNDDEDFQLFKDFLIVNQSNCAQQSCLTPHDDLSKKLAGGYIALLELNQLISTAEEELKKIKPAVSETKGRREFC